MAGEITVPLLPCGSIDDIAEFYRTLGFEQTYRQTRPNPYVALRREDLHLHFFGLPNFDPEQSYGSCLVQVPDIEALYEAFAAGMRAAHGKLLVAGIPRMTRPRRRKNADGHSGFALVDPGGNWIRISSLPRTSATPTRAAGKLAVALENAIALGDSKGDEAQAAKILDATLAREQDRAAATDLVEALVYRAELALRLADVPGARATLARVHEIPLDERDRATLATTLATVHDLEAAARET
ncbi:bleomycin resistance protein [Nocardia takedensis]|uniref:bleomycin resistance protein n=1 Tax=Nocardia takedensis TaxID=259390 RepID=UPI0003120262|nr:VOC family protein [Nocardia takedensis]